VGKWLTPLTLSTSGVEMRESAQSLIGDPFVSQGFTSPTIAAAVVKRTRLR
jgi:hypothetical protein